MKNQTAIEIEGYSIDGVSIGGHETCVMFPSLRLAFDIGRCPPRVISQDFVFISHSHMDHINSCNSRFASMGIELGMARGKDFSSLHSSPITLNCEILRLHCYIFKLTSVREGGLPMYVATRGLYKMKPPTIIVPKSIKENVESLFEVYRKLDSSELKHNLIGLDVGEEFYMRKDLKVKAFRTYHVIESQGYVVYSIKQKLKKEYIGLSGNEIKNLKAAGVEITDTVTNPEVAFTGDTMSDFVVDEANVDALRAKILIMESTFLDDSVSIEHARDYGHVHLFEIVKYAEKFENKAILLTHFSARYTVKEIEDAVSVLPPPLAGRVFTLTQGF